MTRKKVRTGMSSSPIPRVRVNLLLTWRSDLHVSNRNQAFFPGQDSSYHFAPSTASVHRLDPSSHDNTFGTATNSHSYAYYLTGQQPSAEFSFRPTLSLVNGTAHISPSCLSSASSSASWRQKLGMSFAETAPYWLHEDQHA